MDGRALKRVWRSGEELSLGAWVALTDPLATRLLCDAGYEWLMIDAEHRPFDAETLRTLIATMRCRGVLPWYRVRPMTRPSSSKLLTSVQKESQCP